MKFKSFYNLERFRYIHGQISNSEHFHIQNLELIPKTACFFSDDLDLYIDTSDGVNDDLKINEYCGRILSCIRMSKGKRFIFFKAAYSSLWSKNIEQLAQKNNGIVVPFFKWSFNPEFYKYTLPELGALRNRPRSGKYDIGLFANFNKVYDYPNPSLVDPRISYSDHQKFNLKGASDSTGKTLIKSRPDILKKISNSSLSSQSTSMPYKEYMVASMDCKSILNPPGIGEYTSRMMDQTAVGNLLILRKNSYDNGLSWKEYIPEVDFSKDNWQSEYESILRERSIWAEKCLYYYENCWSPKAIFNYFMAQIESVL